MDYQKALAEHLETEELGRNLVYLPEVLSTNLVARELAVSSPPCPSGTVVIADQQTGGKGRLGRQWVSPPGGIYMSVVLRPRIAPEQVPQLAVLAGYAVSEALYATAGLVSLVKWPNDVLVNDLKIAGILCESALQGDKVDHVVVGIGVNVDQEKDDLPQGAISMRVAGASRDRRLVAAAILNTLEPILREHAENGLGKLGPRISASLAWIDRQVQIRDQASSSGYVVCGTFLGIDSCGQALVQVPGRGTIAVPAGDLSLRLTPYSS